MAGKGRSSLPARLTSGTLVLWQVGHVVLGKQCPIDMNVHCASPDLHYPQCHSLSRVSNSVMGAFMHTASSWVLVVTPSVERLRLLYWLKKVHFLPTKDSMQFFSHILCFLMVFLLKVYPNLFFSFFNRKSVNIITFLEHGKFRHKLF